MIQDNTLKRKVIENRIRTLSQQYYEHEINIICLNAVNESTIEEQKILDGIVNATKALEKELENIKEG